MLALPHTCNHFLILSGRVCPSGTLWPPLHPSAASHPSLPPREDSPPHPHSSLAWRLLPISHSLSDMSVQTVHLQAQLPLFPLTPGSSPFLPVAPCDFLTLHMLSLNEIDRIMVPQRYPQLNPQEKGFCKCDWIRDLEKGRLTWIFWVGPT